MSWLIGLLDAARAAQVCRECGCSECGCYLVPAAPPALDADRLARALMQPSVMRFVEGAWVEGGVSEPGYASTDEMAAVIAAAYAAESGA